MKLVAGEELGPQLMQGVESTAAAHRGYQQLFDVDTFYRDSDRLYAQMSSLGPQADSCPSSPTCLGFSAH